MTPDDEAPDAGTGNEYPTDIRDSTPGSTGPQRAAGDMGVSSERVGHAGPRQTATDGIRDVRTDTPDADESSPPEQTPDGPEENPEGLAPKAGYPSRDPRSAEKPFTAKPDV